MVPAKVGDEMVVMSAEMGNYIVASELGARIWEYETPQDIDRHARNCSTSSRWCRKSAAPRSRRFSANWRRMVRLRLIQRLALRFRQIDNRRRALLIEAVVGLLAARLALIFIPFPRLARRIGVFVPPSDPRALTAKAKAAPEQTRLAESISWAVTRAARYVPFKAVCLPQAIAARLMLERRGIRSVMHLGAAKRMEKPLDAHAWLDAAGVEVTGYPVAADFAEIACFV
jgi:Transglutaminase-like superfamily